MITIGGQLDGLMPPLAACHIVVHYCHVLCYWFGEINFLLLLLLLLLLVLVCCMSSTSIRHDTDGDKGTRSSYTDENLPREDLV